MERNRVKREVIGWGNGFPRCSAERVGAGANAAAAGIRWTNRGDTGILLATATDGIEKMRRIRASGLDGGGRETRERGARLPCTFRNHRNSNNDGEFRSEEGATNSVVVTVTRREVTALAWSWRRRTRVAALESIGRRETEQQARRLRFFSMRRWPWHSDGRAQRAKLRAATAVREINPRCLQVQRRAQWRWREGRSIVN